jgi:hypothetical protein
MIYIGTVTDHSLNNAKALARGVYVRRHQIQHLNDDDRGPSSPVGLWLLGSYSSGHVKLSTGRLRSCDGCGRTEDSHEPDEDKPTSLAD